MAAHPPHIENENIIKEMKYIRYCQENILGNDNEGPGICLALARLWIKCFFSEGYSPHDGEHLLRKSKFWEFVNNKDNAVTFQHEQRTGFNSYGPFFHNGVRNFFVQSLKEENPRENDMLKLESDSDIDKGFDYLRASHGHALLIFLRNKPLDDDNTEMKNIGHFICMASKVLSDTEGVIAFFDANWGEISFTFNLKLADENKMRFYEEMDDIKKRLLKRIKIYNDMGYGHVYFTALKANNPELSYTNQEADDKKQPVPVTVEAGPALQQVQPLVEEESPCCRNFMNTMTCGFWGRFFTQPLTPPDENEEQYLLGSANRGAAP